MSYTIKINKDQINLITEKYRDNSLPLTNNYTLFRAKINSSVITIFKTNNMLIQGTDDKNTYCEIGSLLDIPIKLDETDVNINTIPIIKNSIGTDEVGTGDFFGPIVVAGCFVRSEDISYLAKLKVKDSKEISDAKILEIAPLIMEKCIYSYYILDNLKYNFLTIKYTLNMNALKAKMHNSVVNTMRKKAPDFEEIVIDAFTTPSNYFAYLRNENDIYKDIILEEKAENKYLSVACASIIARYFFLKEMENISNFVGYDLPKGAGKPVDSVLLKILQEKGINIFKNISKMNFNNLTKLTNKKN